MLFLLLMLLLSLLYSLPNYFSISWSGRWVHCKRSCLVRLDLECAWRDYSVKLSYRRALDIDSCNVRLLEGKIYCMTICPVCNHCFLKLNVCDPQFDGRFSLYCFRIDTWSFFYN